MKSLHSVSFILLVIGGLNWLLVGLFQYDIVAALLGGMSSLLARIVYTLVGVSAVYLIVTHKQTCKHCDKAAAPAQGGM